MSDDCNGTLYKKDIYELDAVLQFQIRVVHINKTNLMNSMSFFNSMMHEYIWNVSLNLMHTNFLNEYCTLKITLVLHILHMDIKILSCYCHCIRFVVMGIILYDNCVSFCLNKSRWLVILYFIKLNTFGCNIQLMSCLTVCYMNKYQDISIIEAKNEQPVHAIINFIFVFPHVTYHFTPYDAAKSIEWSKKYLIQPLSYFLMGMV